MNDDFKDTPQSIGEIRSDKSRDGSQWTPRECLIAMLREIDNGLQVETLVICIEYKDDIDSRFRYSQSTKSGLKSVGLIAHCSAMMIVD